MKGRPSKITVDYFPHYTSSGKTIFTLESLYGNDGYAFWFKLLEILGSSENHTFRYENICDWLFLVAKTKVTEEKAVAILQTLADLGAIDQSLHREKVVWSDNFVFGLIPVYSKRSTEMPVKPILRGEKSIVGEKIPQSKVKDSKEENKQTSANYSPKFEAFWEKYPRKKGKAKAYSFWKKQKCENGLFDLIMDSLEKHMASNDWIKDGGKYIPYGSTWVGGKAWEDTVECEEETKWE